MTTASEGETAAIDHNSAQSASGCAQSSPLTTAGSCAFAAEVRIRATSAAFFQELGFRSLLTAVYDLSPE